VHVTIETLEAAGLREMTSHGSTLPYAFWAV